MKKIRENLNFEEFKNYIDSILLEMESEILESGQVDKLVPYTENLKVKILYSVGAYEVIEIFYVENYNEENDEVTYDIYE